MVDIWASDSVSAVFGVLLVGVLEESLHIAVDPGLTNIFIFVLEPKVDCAGEPILCFSGHLRFLSL